MQPPIIEPPENVRYLTRSSVVILYFILFSAVLALGIVGYRVGLGSDISLILCALSALTFTLALPVAVLSINPPERSVLELAVGPAIVASLLIFLGLSFLGRAGAFIAVASAFAALVRLVWLSRAHVVGSFWHAIICFLIIFILYFVGLAGSRYGSFIADYLALGGRASADVYYHWSIVNALRYFNQVAIGVDGLLGVKYYPMAHFVAARLAAMSNADSSGMAFIVMRAIYFTPLCLTAWSLMALSIDQRQSHEPITTAFRMSLLIFLYDSFGRDFFDSESHVLGLAFLGLIVPSALYAMNPIKNKRFELLIWGALIFCLALVTATKVTTGFIVLVLLGYAALRAFYQRPVLLLAIWSLATATAFVVYRHVISSMSVGTLNASISENFGLDLHWYYPMAHYSITIAAIGALILVAKSAGPVWPQLRHGKIPLLELLVVVLIASTLPALFIPIPAGSGYYMTHPQMWVALPIFIVIGVPFLVRKFSRLGNNGAMRSFPAWGLLAALVVVTMVHAALFFFDRTAQAVSQSTFVRTGDASFYASRKRKAVEQDMERALPLLLHSSYYWPNLHPMMLKNLVDQLKDLRAAHGNEISAYVSPQAREFWNLTDNCFVSSMLPLALTGIPLIDGLPPMTTGCQLKPNISYGFEIAGRRSSDAPVNDVVLCDMAKRRGFSKVVRIENTISDARIVRCIK